MSENVVQAYLEEELLNKRNIVTFRLLSRKLKIHVNEAKNALATFYTKTRGNQQHIYATFWLSGETRESGGDDVSTWSTLLVDEGSLENAKTSFKSITSLHVYALTPSPLENVSDLCASSGTVREIDNAGGAELAATVGKITNQTIVALSTSNSKKDPTQRAQASGSSKPTPSIQPRVKEEQKPSQISNEPVKAKPKQAGTLDWSKGRTKEVKKEVVEPTKTKKPQVKEEGEPSKDTSKKRKASPLTEPKEEAPTAPKPKPKPVVTKTETAEKARIKKGAIVSDDDTDDEPVVKSKGRYRHHKIVDEDYDHDVEPSLKAMMDIDDSEVIKASSSRQAAIATDVSDEEPPASEPAADAEDSMAVDDELSDDPAPKPKPRQRKVKKAIPIGRNGLKKKRVVKSKTDFDDKGYMVTIDYSSYESVDEEAEEEAPAVKPKGGRAKNTSGTKATARTSLASTKPAAKALSDSEPESKPAQAPPPRTTSNPSGLKKPAPAKSTPAATKGKPTPAKGGQKSLNSFFGAKPKQ